MNKVFFERNLEGLRGFCALMVVFGHLFYYSRYLDPNKTTWLIGRYIPDGHFSVLVFFCLSGYVIGYTNKNKLANKNDILQYIKKRFIRLYPIYVVSILVTLFFVIRAHNFELATLLKYLTFTQSYFNVGYFENNPLWSLGYEVLYYLLFIPLSYFNISRWKTLIFCMGIALVNIKLLDKSQVPVFSYSFGFVFWLIGLMIAEYGFEKCDMTPNSNFIVSHFFLLLSMWFYSLFISILPTHYLIEYFTVSTNLPFIYSAITFRDMFYLPFCIYFILIFTNANLPFMKYFVGVMYTIPFFVIIWNFFSGSLQSLSFCFPTFFYILSLFFLWNKKVFIERSKVLVELIIYSGGISYALYVMHFPIISFFQLENHFFTGTIYALLGRLVVYLIILTLVCIWLEKYMQPYIKKYFNKPS